MAHKLISSVAYHWQPVVPRSEVVPCVAGWVVGGEEGWVGGWVLGVEEGNREGGGRMGTIIIGRPVLLVEIMCFDPSPSSSVCMCVCVRACGRVFVCV